MNECLEAGGGRGVLCADGHKGYSQPVGGVIGYQGKISVSGVGFDIACGNMACKTDAKLSDVRDRMEKIMDDVFTQISFGVGRVNGDVPEGLHGDSWRKSLARPLRVILPLSST